MTRLWAILIALLLVFPAAAHQQKVSISTVEHNPRSGMIEIIHRVPVHDAEHALRQQGQRAPDIFNDLESRREFARYVARRFDVRAGGEPLALTLLGTEIDGGNLIVYQEGPSPGLGTVLSVQSQILTDIWSRQVNRVNVGTGSRTTTLVFREGDPAQTAQLQR